MANGKAYRKLLAKWERRRAQIRAMWCNEYSLSQIAARFGITKGRVWQIINGK